jgi:chorismate mutase
VAQKKLSEFDLHILTQEELQRQIWRRASIGVDVADSKYAMYPRGYDALVRAGNIGPLFAMLTDEDTETEVMKRVVDYASQSLLATSPGDPQLLPKVLTSMYRDLVIPMTKHVQVVHLFRKLDVQPPSVVWTISPFS